MGYDGLSRRSRDLIAKIEELEVPVEIDIDIELPPEPVWLVTGSIKSGKSSLMNDLVGDRLLPDTRPITDTRTYGRIRRGPPGTALLVFDDDDETRAVSLDEARALLSKEEPDDPLLARIDRVEIYTDAEVVATLSLEDSPGTGDAGVEDRFVRRDVADRALNSTGVLYLIAGSALPGETDAEFLTPLIEAGVPVRVLFSRFDQVEDDDLDEDPKDVRIKELRHWRIDLPPDRIHFVSSYLHRNKGPEQGGIQALANALAADAPLAGSRLDAQGARLLAERLDEGIARLDEVIEEMSSAARNEDDRTWLRTRRAGALQFNHAVAASQALQLACSAAERNAVSQVRAACESQKIGLQELWTSTWGPAFGEQISKAATAFDAALREIEDAPMQAQPLQVPSTPVLALLEKPSELDLSALDFLDGDFAELLKGKKPQGGDKDDSSPPGGGFREAGKQLLEEIRLQLWIQENVNRARIGVAGAVEQLTLAAERRLDLLNDEIQDALNELEDDLAAARERHHHEVLRVRRALDRIREEARRHARKSI